MLKAYFNNLMMVYKYRDTQILRLLLYSINPITFYRQSKEREKYIYEARKARTASKKEKIIRHARGLEVLKATGYLQNKIENA